jgi:hypothetical protein
MGGLALIVDAEEGEAKDFYGRDGFRRFYDTPLGLYLPQGG